MKDYSEYKKIIDKYLLDYIPQVDVKAATLQKSMEYSIMAGGKRLRPVLVLASCDFAGGDPYEAVPMACALEYIHTYSLIHDDLPAMDNDDLRRGQPTNHKVYGENIAILAGDGLLNTAAEAILRDCTYYYDDTNKLKRHVRAGLKIMKNAGINGMVAGQVADVENQNKACSDELINFIDKNKTSMLLDAAIQAGLIIGGASEEVLNDFKDFAYYMGMSFQIADDLLDIVGDEKVLGKSVGKDADEEKCNYAIVHGVDGARAKLHEFTEKGVNALSSYGEDASFFTDLILKLESRNK